MGGIVLCYSSVFCFCRRVVLKKLKETGVPVPEYAVLNRNEDGTTGMYVSVCVHVHLYRMSL